VDETVYRLPDRCPVLRVSLHVVQDSHHQRIHAAFGLHAHTTTHAMESFAYNVGKILTEENNEKTRE
jgi:hypothetical protein